MDDKQQEQESKNRKIVEGLREVFAGLAQKLSPEVEPAPTYGPTDGDGDPDSE